MNFANVLRIADTWRDRRALVGTISCRRMSLSEPNFHHYVSNFYLKGFAAEDRIKKYRVQVFDKFELKTFETRTNKTGGAKNFNRSFSKTDPNNVEKFYSDAVEGPAGAALKRVLQSKSLSSRKDLESLLLFFAMTTARNPKQRAMVEAPMRQLDCLLIKSALSDDGNEILEKRNSRDLFPEEHVGMELPLIKPIFDSLCSKNWAILEPDEGAGEFITSDFPLQIVTANEDRPWGFESPGATIFAPLSKDLAMLGQSGSLKISKLTLDKTMVASFNFGTLIDAYRNIFFKTDSFLILDCDSSGVLHGRDFFRKCIG